MNKLESPCKSCVNLMTDKDLNPECQSCTKHFDYDDCVIKTIGSSLPKYFFEGKGTMTGVQKERRKNDIIFSSEN